MKELYPGDQGIWVQYLQLALQRAGQQVMLDGIFGPKTCAAVEKVMGSSGKCAVKEAQWNRLLPFLRGYITHEVKAGDTFFSIAKMYDTTMERVMHANPGTDAGALQIGSTVVVLHSYIGKRIHHRFCLNCRYSRHLPILFPVRTDYLHKANYLCTVSANLHSCKLALLLILSLLINLHQFRQPTFYSPLHDIHPMNRIWKM